jgi:hypothetical protein
MDKITEQQPKSSRQSLLYWILRIAVGFNLLWYGSEVVFNLISILRTSSEPVTWQNIILATSYNWDSFLRVRIFALGLGIIGSFAGWGWELYRQKKTN